jgi:hypothetical protein
LTAEHGPITVDGTEDVTDVLQVAFRHSPVLLKLTQTETFNLATGAINYTFTATNATPVSEPPVETAPFADTPRALENKKLDRFFVDRNPLLLQIGLEYASELREEDVDAAMDRFDARELGQLGDEDH